MNSYLTPGIFWQYYRDQPALKNAGDVINFSNNDNYLNLKENQQGKKETMAHKMLK